MYVLELAVQFPHLSETDLFKHAWFPIAIYCILSLREKSDTGSDLKKSQIFGFTADQSRFLDTRTR